MKLGILGGSFNPVHIGHLHLAYKALSVLKLDRVVFVPAYKSPFKLNGITQHCGDDQTVISQDNSNLPSTANERIDLLAAAIEGDARFAIDYCEIRREGVSYTIDTLEDIIYRYMPEGKPVLLIGDDLAGEFTKWRDYEKILQLADVAVARRINAPLSDCPFPHIQIQNDIVDISSSVIRQSGGGIEENSEFWQNNNSLKLFPKLEDDYKMIQESGIPDIETEARKTLGVERFLHSRNTALAAYDLCRRFDINPITGYLAGIAHDLAKQMDNKQLLKIVKSEGYDISPLEKNRPNLLHGKAAAVLLRERFCIKDKEVLNAVAFHTSGHEDMEPLEKIIYIADKTESTRNIEPALRKMCREADLDTILYAVLEKTINKLKAKDLDLSEDTLKLFNKVKER